MSGRGAINKAEEMLVVRVDRSSTILDILYYNDTLPKTAEELIGQTFKSIGLEQIICEEWEERLCKVFLTVKKEVFESQIKNKYYQISYLPEWKVKRHIVTVLIIVRDITKQQRLTEKMASNQVKMQMAGEIAKVGYFKWDSTNHYFYWSDQQYRNFGYVPQEIIPTVEFLRSRVYPADLDRMQGKLARLDEKQNIQFQFRIIKADGSLGWLYCRINVMTKEEGCSVTLFGITQDITEQKQAEERIHSVEKELAFTNKLYSRSTYLNKLLFNDYPVEQIIKTLNEFGIETQVAYCCFIIKLTDNLLYNTEILGNGITPLMARKQAVLIWLAEGDWGLVWRCHDDIVILVAASDLSAANKQSQIGFAKKIIGEIGQVFPHFDVKVGISGTSSIPVNFRDTYEKGHRAVVIAASVDDSSVIHGDDIGLYEVAFQLLQDENTCTMVQKTIGRLAEHDEVRGSNLLITLECILEQGNLKAVAQQLFIHHNTVIWRKRRIEEFLEISLDQMETKMLLLLYVRIWNLKQNIV